ncbi:hypothetical protein BD560DRAFT_358576 [Blakeslea trispora]|nr:hypothetical protein BD560DRAFT_358576 [Blakeslea trispora]
MGQHPSKAHASFTFGYINQEDLQETDETTRPEFNHQQSSDFVLDHPHLYQLEPVCHHCSADSPVFNKAIAVVDQSYTGCRQNKRLSLVRRNLANDLNYIDTTYYPNMPHYTNAVEALDVDSSSLSDQNASGSMGQHCSSDEMVKENDGGDTDTLRDEQGWSRLTMSEFTPSTLQRLVSSPLLTIDLSGKSLIKLSSSIGYLHNLTKLNISNNQMTNLPRAIGQLKNLRSLNASNNQLEYLPDTITTLPKLKAVNFSNNKLTLLPQGMSHLKHLIILLLDHNQLTQLPRELANLEALVTLNISHNPLRSIPAEISTLKSLRKLRAEGCPFETEFIHSIVHDPPSLFETCARQIVRHKMSLPIDHFKDYFERQQTCSFCSGPFFDSFVTRGKFIERTNSQVIALDYQLCCAHWTDEQDRLLSMFSTPSYRVPMLTEGSMDNTQQPISSSLLDESLASSLVTEVRATGTSPYPSEDHSTLSYPTVLSFATLHSRQLEEANRILQRHPHQSSSLSLQSTRKSTHLKQGVIQLGSRLNIRKHRNRERSGTI